MTSYSQFCVCKRNREQKCLYGLKGANRKIAYDVTPFPPKKVADQTLQFMLERYRANTNFGIILKTDEKLIKNWNELLLVGFVETNKFNQKYIYSKCG